MRKTTLGAYEHQEVPFERLVGSCSRSASMSHSPLFQDMFTLQNAVDGDAGRLTLGEAEAELYASAKLRQL